MSQDRLSSEIPPLLTTSKERILQALCVAVGADHVYFFPFMDSEDETHLTNPLREVNQSLKIADIHPQSAANKYNGLKIYESEDGKSWFSDDLNIHGMRGTLYFVNETKAHPELSDASQLGFNKINMNIYQSLKGALTDIYKAGIEVQPAKALVVSGMMKFANETMGFTREWHNESCKHSDNVGILFEHFLNKTTENTASLYYDAFKDISGLDRMAYNAMAVLHDIGKTLIPKKVLTFEGIYSDEQRAQMQQHAAAGYYIMGGFGPDKADLAGFFIMP